MYPLLKKFIQQTLILFLALSSAEALAMEVDITFSSKTEDGIPLKTNEREFTCSDKVHILMDFRGLPPGTHQVELQWIDPRGDRQELTQFEAYNGLPDTRIWAWMRLHAPENSGLVRAFDQSHGMRDFIGRWTVKILIDGDQVGRATFDVLC